MVVILQQSSTTSGNKFISSVVDTPQDSSINNSFSLNSQLSISERSAAYKQRIDSLFSRPANNKLSSGNHPQNPKSLEPFRIRVDGKSISPTQGIHVKSASLVTTTTTTSSSTIVVSGPLKQAKTKNGDPETDEDDYAQINDKASIVTDSLNHRVKISTISTKKGVSTKSGNNISSVRITCEDSESSAGSQLQSLMLTSSSGEEVVVGQSEAGSSDRVMWRNSNYGENSPGNPGSRIEKPFSTIRCSPAGMLKFSVEYLGSVPVKGNTAALQDLQAPLRSLYMNFLTNSNMMTGQLAITSDGLRFEAPKIRLVNPFTTIAVWAAVKFVGRGDPVNECAFMPLISDPEGQDKSRLFGRMNPELTLVYQGLLRSSSTTFKNPPIFACVMREASFSLDCHAFACKCAEDAIVIAANLYQSLVDKMRSGKEGESGYGSLTRGSPTTQSSMNQNRSSSSASSLAKEAPGSDGGKGVNGSSKTVLAQTSSSSSTQQDSRAVFSDTESIAPVRPPRKKKKISEIPFGNLKRYNSDDSVLLNFPNRRRSIRATQGHYIKNKKRVQIHTPDDDDSSLDSFSDSIDQVLDRIVNPCGMSFNELKPSHQELILKIALTLTQDQIYKKSKQAMKKQQQQKYRKKVKSPSSGDLSDENTQFMSHFLKSISKMSLSGKAAPISKRSPLGSKPHFGASAISARAKQPKIFTKPQITVPSKAILKKTKEDDIPFMSFCSGCACDKCSDKCYCSLPPKNGVSVNGERIMPTPSTSTTATSTPTQHPICSSTGDTDVTRSRKSCGYDTDSCAESEKCYCSLQRVKSNGLKIYNINLDTETSDTDTNSYDLEHFNNPTFSEVGLSSKLSHPHRPVEILSYHPSRRLSYCFSPPLGQKSSSKHGSPMKDGDGKLSMSYKKGKKFRDMNLMENPQLSKNKVLLITGSNASGQVVYKDSPFNMRQGLDFGEAIARRLEKSKSSSNKDLSGQKSKTPDEEPSSSSSASEKKPEFAPDKMLSIKKSAEIAAMFTDLKLNPSTNFILNGGSEIEELGQHQESTSIDFQTSLGYLP